MSTKINLNAKQREAVEYLAGPLLVLAGPGTGKTQLLSARVAHILEETDANPENILCITFTESGASNMRTRLTSMIGQKAAGRVHIHTYHAFGSDILAQYKNYATSPTRLLEAPIDTVTGHKIIRQIQEQLPATDIMKTAAVGDILTTIAEAKAARLTAAELAQIAEQNVADTAVLNPLCDEVLQKLVPRMKFELAVEQVYQPLLAVLAQQIAQQPIAGQIEREANHYVRELSQLLEEQQAAEKPSVAPLTRWKDKTFEKDAAGNYRLKNLVANKKLQSLSKIMQAYDDYLKAQGLFDFADMIEEAIRVLKEDEGFRLSLKEVYRYILLDEFQDTNPSQFELIKLLTDDERPDIMAVGDDDQAIFAFQGANASNLLDFEEHYRAKVISLTDNYRSTQEILDFSRKIADQITDSFAKQHAVEKRLTAHRAAPGQTQLSRHEFVAADAEYYWVGQQVRALLAQGVEPSEIAIITPKHKYIAPLLPYLKTEPEVKVAYEKRENILEEPKVRQLLVLARFVHELATEQTPTYRLLEILSFPYWRVSPLATLAALEKARSERKNALEYLAGAEDAELQQVARFVADLVVASFDAPLELMLDYMIGTAELNGFRSPYLEFYTKDEQSYTTFSLYENLAVLREHLRSHTKAVAPKLKDLVEFLDDYEVAGEAVINTSPYQEAEQAVQILTAHKAKGLEYRHVFLIATDNLAWGKAKGNNNLLSLPRNLVQIRHTGITDDERLRLLFVAMTRAAESLTMTNSTRDFAGKTPERLEYLEEYEDGEKVISPFLPEPAVVQHYQDLSAAEQAQSMEQHWLAAYQTLTPELKPYLLQRLENYKLTATDLTTFIDVIYGGPMEFYKNKVLRAPMEPASEAIKFGNLLHATFEAVTSQGLTDAEAIDFFQKQAVSEPLTEAERKDILERGAASLEVALKEFGELLRRPGARAEVDFYREHLQLDEVALTGKIDHLEIDEKAKTIEVYDFKTGTYHPEKWLSHPTLYKYAMQLGFYKLLLNLSTKYSKYKVTKGHILFVSPDVEGKVYDKVYEFNTADEEALRQLMRAVYRQIKTLGFLPPSELAVYPDAGKTLKQMKEFIALVLAS